MADKKTDAPAEVTAEQTPQQEIVELANCILAQNCETLGE